MKKTLKLAVAASVLCAPAMAANMESPLYVPAKGQVYTKTSVGLMYKKADDTIALQNKGKDGFVDFPVYRIGEELGYGITDRLSVNGQFGYTSAPDSERAGMHLGRVGLNYRIFDDASKIVWDVYADANLGGLNKLQGSATMLPTGVSFNYDNYTHGRWGYYAGTRVGRTWDKLTAALYAEVTQTFGNDNNEIDISATGLSPIFNGEDIISLNLKSTTELNLGLETFYEINDKWGMGFGFAYKQHASNGVESVSSDYNKLIDAGAAAKENVGSSMVGYLVDGLSDMKDGFEEYVVSVSGTRNISDTMQVSLYGEYTFDTAKENSQNGSDIKAELGVRFNAAF